MNTYKLLLVATSVVSLSWGAATSADEALSLDIHPKSKPPQLL